MSSTDSSPWPLPPLIPGDWRTLAGPDVTALIARYAVVDEESGLDALADEPSISRARACRLPCASDWLLIEAEARLPNGVVGLLTFFFGPERRIHPIVWAPYAIAELFWERPDEPIDLEAIKQFLLLAVNCTVGDTDRFRLVDSGAELRALAEDPAAVPRELCDSVRPVTVDFYPGGWAGEGTVVYGNSVFHSEFRIGSNGELEMTDDTLIQELPTKRESFFGPLRNVWKAP